MNDTKKSPDDLRFSFENQLNFLHKSSVEFDNGDYTEAERISVALRILLHDGRGRSKSLRTLLSIDNQFIDTSFFIPKPIVREGEERSLSEERWLFKINITNKYYAPIFNEKHEGNRVLPFDEWWNGNIFTDIRGTTFTRKLIVLSVAEQDGGAHVDSSLNVDYHSLSREGSHGFKHFKLSEINGVKKAIDVKHYPSPHNVIIRQIAHEVLISLDPLYNYSGKDKYPGIFHYGLQAIYKPKKP